MTPETLAYAIADQLFSLLRKQSPARQQQSMREVESMLESEGLNSGSPRRDDPSQFSLDLIVNNPSLQPQLQLLARQRFNPESCETPGDLMSWLLPSNDSLS